MIVVIGILAAITIVSYGGVTARANTTSAQTAAHSVALKADTYFSEVGRYPLVSTELTSDSTKNYYIAASTFSITTLLTQPATTSTLRWIKCGTIPYATQANITSANITGLRLHYWSYTSQNWNNYQAVGTDLSSTVACPAS